MSPLSTARRGAAALALAAAGLAAPAARAAAQTPALVVERPVAFDSAGRVQLLTPALAARLRLAAPAFPVQGPFVEARLFAAPEAAGAGPAVLSVTRPGGAVERYALGAAERAALAAAVAGGLAAAGPGLRGDTAIVVSEPAGRAFVRSQTTLGLLVYGPALAGVVNNGNGPEAAIAYAVGAGGAFGASLAISQDRPVTRAQSILSGSMGYGFGAAGAAILGAANVREPRAYAGAILGGALAGSITGFQRAAGMTDAEAAGSSAAAFLGAATSLGLSAALGADDIDQGSGRTLLGVHVAALATGYALGPRYAHARRYRVTAGDVQTLTPAAVTGALLGAAVGNVFDDRGDRGRRNSDRGGWAGATLGLVAGTLAGDRLLVRRADHTASEADLLRLGTAVGGALGLTIVNASADDGTALLGAAGAGALAGLAFTEAVLRPARDGGPARLRTSSADAVDGRDRPRRLRLSPSGLALARLTARRGGRGTFPLGTLTF